MKQPLAKKFNGSAVQIRINGANAIGILFFTARGEAYVTTLCYTEPGPACPTVRRLLSEDELKSLSPRTHNELHSSIAISTEAEADREAHDLSVIEAETRALAQRIKAAHDKVQQHMAEFDRLTAEANAAADRIQSLRNLTEPTPRPAPAGKKAGTKARTKPKAP